MLGPPARKSTDGKRNAAPVKTILRVRPFLKQEVETETCLKVIDSSTVHITNSRNNNECFAYHFEACLDTASTQESVFKHVRPVLDKIFEFRNATVFAYGITGAGKTHTMDGTTEDPGLIPRAAAWIFSKIKACSQDTNESFSVKMSHLEIYNEKVFDLSQQGRVELPIRQDASGSIVVANLVEKPANSFEDFQRQYQITRENRSTASTELNECSSRSHSVIRICLTRSRNGRSITTKLQLIDLAGSEDNRKTGNNRDRMVESGNINKSLFMLNQVVDALNSGATNIPYRNSKLTRLLQDSLGGDADSMMITNVAPSSRFYLDTLNTLNMSKRTRRIVNQSQVQPAKKPDKTSAISVGITASEKDVPQASSAGKPFVPGSPSRGVDIGTLLEAATPHTKRGILKALKLSNPESNSPPADSRKRALNDLLAEYPLRMPEPTVKRRVNPMVVESSPSTLPLVQPPTLTKQSGAEPIDTEAAMNDLLEVLNGNNVKSITSLKGIGVNRAQNIVDHFQKVGKYTSLEELSNIGIGLKIIQKLKEDFINNWKPRSND